MPVELRKRKAPAAPAAPAPPAPKKAKANPVKAAAKKVKNAVVGKQPNGTSPGKLAVGDTINLDGFGGEIETNDGQKTTLKLLVEESKSGVVLFTYPKASTPGCKSHRSIPWSFQMNMTPKFPIFEYI
jgi:peroxiredoxin Q/BCP